MTIIPSAPDGELTNPDGSEQIPLAKGTLDKWMTLINTVVGKLRETAGPTILTLGAIADGEFLRRSGTAVIGGTFNSAPFKNVVINGDMQIAQRGTSFAGLTGLGVYTLDCWLPVLITLGTWTASQEADAPTGTPHRRSLKMLATVADAAPAAGDAALLQTKIEGQFLQAFLKGSSAAKQFALSFWVKSSTTGTYIAELQDLDNARHVAASYTINVANTWERKTITFPADTSGVWDNDSNGSMALNFWMAAGSNFTSGALQTTWAAQVNANRAVGQVNLAAAVNNNLFITGVQLETGPTATDFEFLPFDVQLQRCLRYYQKSFPYATAPVQNAGNVGAFSYIAGKAGAAHEDGFIPFMAKMRVAPVVTFYNPGAANAQVRDLGVPGDCSATTTLGNLSENGTGVRATGNAATAVGNLLVVHWTGESGL